MLVVIAIIVILVTMVIGIAARINTQSKEQLTKNVFALLDAALWQFGDYGYNYSDPRFADFKFPLDCNGFSDTDLENELKDALGATSVSITGDHNDVYSGSEALYFFLSRVPESRKTLDKIDRKLVTNLGSDGQPIAITIVFGADSKEYPLLRVIDPWGITLRYSYYENNKEGPSSSEPEQSSPRIFPVITSAGPDRSFGTADDIASR